MNMSKIANELLQRIVSIELLENGACRGVVKFDDAFCGFDGHFKDNPVVPGVCLLQLVEIIAAKQLDKPLKLVNIAQMKFKTMLKPDDIAEFMLSASEVDSHCNVSCSIQVKERVAARIKMVFETK